MTDVPSPSTWRNNRRTPPEARTTFQADLVPTQRRGRRFQTARRTVRFAPAFASRPIGPAVPVPAHAAIAGFGASRAHVGGDRAVQVRRPIGQDEGGAAGLDVTQTQSEARHDNVTEVKGPGVTKGRKGRGGARSASRRRRSSSTSASSERECSSWRRHATIGALGRRRRRVAPGVAARGPGHHPGRQLTAAVPRAQRRTGHPAALDRLVQGHPTLSLGLLGQMGEKAVPVEPPLSPAAGPPSVAAVLPART